MTQQRAIRKPWMGATPGGEPPRAIGDLPRVSGHGLLWTLVGLTGLGLFLLALILVLAPTGHPPAEQGPQSSQVAGRTGAQATTLGSGGSAQGASATVPGSSAATTALSPDPMPEGDPGPATAPEQGSPGPAPNPTLDFENAPGVLSTTLRTRRKEALKAYPTEALGAIALGLEDLRLSPTNRAGQLQVNLGEQIRYEQKDHEVPKQSRRLLDGIGRLLAENPDTLVEVLSHTDDEGDAGFNLRLSQRRADAIKEYLAGRGVDQARITARGRGEEAPLIATGKRTPTRAERAKNRRTELMIGAYEPAEQGPAEEEDPEAAATVTAATPAEAD